MAGGFFSGARLFAYLVLILPIVAQPTDTSSSRDYQGITHEIIEILKRKFKLSAPNASRVADTLKAADPNKDAAESFLKELQNIKFPANLSKFAIYQGDDETTFLRKDLNPSLSLGSNTPPLTWLYFFSSKFRDEELRKTLENSNDYRVLKAMNQNELGYRFRTHGMAYSGSFELDGHSNSEKLQFLKNFWQALSRLQHPNFGKIFLLNVTKKGSAPTNFRKPHEPIFMIGFPIDASPETMIQHLSRDPGNELALLGLRVKQLDQVSKTISENSAFAPNLAILALDQICSSKREFLDFLSLLSFDSKIAQLKRYPTPPGFHANLSYSLTNSSFEKLNILLKEKKIGGLEAHVSLLGQKQKDNVYFRLNYDGNCFVRDFSIITTDDRGKFRSLKKYDSTGKLLNVIEDDQPILSLEKAYALFDCQEQQRFSYHEFLSRAQLENKVIIGILDSGVKYNDPLLSHSISRFAPPSAPIYREIDLLKNEIDSLETKLGNLKKQSQENAPEIERTLLVLKNKKATLSKLHKWSTSPGWDFSDNDPLPFDYHPNPTVSGHGSRVAYQSISHSPELEVLPLRINLLDYNDFNSYEAIHFASLRGAKIIVGSFGTPDKNYYLHLERAIRNHPHMLFIFAAGNDSKNIDDHPSYPASFSIKYPNVISAASVDSIGWPSSFSNWGPQRVQFAHPGENIPDHFSNEIPKKITEGTSYSAPRLGQIAGRMWSINPDLDYSQIISQLARSSKSHPKLEGKVQFGIVDEQSALIEAYLSRNENTSSCTPYSPKFRILQFTEPTSTSASHTYSR